MDHIDDLDEDLEIWDQLVCAVRWLTRHDQRPELTLRAAVREALIAWIGEQAALHHADQPFDPVN